MLCAVASRLEERVALAFGEQFPCTADELHRRVCSAAGKRYTLQAVYQELRKLMRQGVVSKSGRYYAPRFPWALELHEYCRKLMGGFTPQPGRAFPEFADGERICWSFRTLSELVGVWSSVVHLLCAQTQAALLQEYVPHVWYHLVSAPLEEQFGALLKKRGMRYRLFVRGNTFLDRTYLPFSKPYAEAIHYGVRDLDPGGRKYYSIAGDYVISVRLAKHVADGIQKLFSEVRGPADFDIHRAATLLARRGRNVLSVELNRTLSAKLVSGLKPQIGGAR